MPGGKGNIKGSDNTNGFQKNPQNINRKGAPRKSFSAFAIKCKDEGITPVGKKEYYEAIASMQNMTVKELKDLQNDKDQVAMLRFIAEDFQDKKQRVKMIQEWRDWLYGKAEQNITTKEDASNLSNLTDEQLLEYQRLIKIKEGKQ